jgi:hypothetical protein
MKLSAAIAFSFLVAVPVFADLCVRVPFEYCQIGCTENYSPTLSVIAASTRDAAIAALLLLPDAEQMTATVAQLPSFEIPWVVVFRSLKSSGEFPQPLIAITTFDDPIDAMMAQRTMSGSAFVVLTNWKPALIRLKPCPISAPAAFAAH